VKINELNGIAKCSGTCDIHHFTYITNDHVVCLVNLRLRLVQLWQISYNFIQGSLRHYWRFAWGCDSGYTSRGVNYAEKRFMKLTPVADVIKLFTDISCDFS
jgi:hypothetical protein